VYALATCSGSILRGTETNRYGDEVDTATVVAREVLASIQETNRRVFDRATQESRTVRVIRAAFQSDVDLRVGDRFRDEGTGEVYAVLAVTAPKRAGGAADLDVELRRVTP
jgi:hypothetical protein